MKNTSHTVEVTAATLYEAVAQGLAAIRGDEWVAGIAQGLNVVKVSVASVPVEHEVRMMDFTNWLERKCGSPREVADRERVRLGVQRLVIAAYQALSSGESEIIHICDVSLVRLHLPEQSCNSFFMLRPRV